MTDDELTQFTTLAKKYEPKDKEKVLTVLKADIHDVFQEINDGGRAAANKDNKKTVETLTAELETAKTTSAQTKAQLDELNGKAPEATKLREQYERQIQDLQTAHKASNEVKDTAMLAERRTTAVSNLVNKLVNEHGINREYAETIVAKRDDVLTRIKPGPNGEVDVLKAGTDLPLVKPGDGKTVIDLLASELAAPIANQWKTSKVSRGSSTTGDNTVNTGTVDNSYDKIRTEVKERTEARAKENQTKTTGLERLRSGRR